MAETTNDESSPADHGLVHNIPFACVPVAIGVWTLGLTYAWLRALDDVDSLKPSLSQMMYDENKAPGKIFMATCLWTSIILLVSNYAFFLPNARAGQSQMRCYILRVVSILGIGVLGMIPGWADQHLHMIAAVLSVVCLITAEMHVLLLNQSLFKDERRWRSLACAALIMGAFFFEIHHIDIGTGKWAAWRNNWMFRFEITICGNAVWQYQLIWAFAHQHLHKQVPSFWHVFPWPHCMTLTIISLDMNHRGEFTKFPAWQSLSVAATEMAMFFLCIRFLYDSIRGREHRLKASGQPYGSVECGSERSVDDVGADFAKAGQA